MTSGLKMLPSACGLGQHFQDLGHSFSLYGPPSRQITYIYYMASSASGKMNQIARCDWLPERARWSHLARSRLPAVSRKQNFTKSHIINPLLTKFVRLNTERSYITRLRCSANQSQTPTDDQCSLLIGLFTQV